ncbi:MAG: SET domain-containing protein [Dehalococcoidia bacterium]
MRDSLIEGCGLFAMEALSEEEVVVVMGGRVLTEEEFQSLNLVKYSAAAIGEGLHILLDTPNPAEYGNHSCDPNTWMADEVTTVARRLIAAGEEITIDYAVLTASDTWDMECTCRAALCRRTIRGDDWRSSELQERYAGHFAPFLNERIARLRPSGS